MTLDQWLDHFTERVAPRYRWTVTATGCLRVDDVSVEEPAKCICPLTAETGQAARYWRFVVHRYRLSSVDAKAIVEAADTPGFPWPAGGLRSRLLAACGLKERDHA